MLDQQARGFGTIDRRREQIALTKGQPFAQSGGLIGMFDPFGGDGRPLFRAMANSAAMIVLLRSSTVSGR
jgi:hypothetical protein